MFWASNSLFLACLDCSLYDLGFLMHLSFGKKKKKKAGTREHVRSDGHAMKG